MRIRKFKIDNTGNVIKTEVVKCKRLLISYGAEDGFVTKTYYATKVYHEQALNGCAYLTLIDGTKIKVWSRLLVEEEECQMFIGEYDITDHVGFNPNNKFKKVTLLRYVYLEQNEEAELVEDNTIRITDGRFVNREIIEED
jgi:hypothetical protein